MNYSVLMSVYRKERPEFLQQAIESMLNQTLPCNDFVLVCDGGLTAELDSVIEKYAHRLQLIRLEKNQGLGIALNTGLEYCKNDLVARMDSDDISVPDRCENQIKAFENDPQLSIVSGYVREFIGDETYKMRVLPLSDEEIREYSRKRNPFNHPAVMFRKTAVLAAGGYTEAYPYFEDYDLWIRMLQNGCKALNLDKVLLNMRISDELYQRRGGFAYMKNLLRFHRHLRKTGWISRRIYYTCAVPHALVCVMPNGIRKAVYKTLRNN